METDLLMQLATSGATTLIGAAATDVWQQAREGFARLFARGDEEKETLAVRRLDALAAAVEQAPASDPEDVRQKLLTQWQTRLIDLIEEQPDTAEALRSLRDDLQAKLPPAQQQWVQNVTATATGAVAQGVMFGNIINHPAPPVLPEEQ